MEYIRLYRNLGLNIIPIKYGDKRPLVKWDEFKKRKSTDEELKEWFEKESNVAIVCGEVSDNLVVLDLILGGYLKGFLRSVMNFLMKQLLLEPIRGPMSILELQNLLVNLPSYSSILM